jgi:hypothetical protein
MSKFFNILLVSRLQSSRKKSGHANEDFVSGFGPSQRNQPMIRDRDVLLDDGLQP